MKHLHIIQTLDLGRSGGLVGVVSLHRAMLRRGMQSYLAYNGAESDVGHPPSSVKLTALFGNRFLFGWNSAATLEEIISSVDVVHVHGLYTYMNYVAGRVCRRDRRLLVYHPHGTLAPAYLRRGRLKKSFVLTAFEQSNFHFASWRALSQVEAEQIRSQIPNAKIIIVPNGVDLPQSTERVFGGLINLPVRAVAGRRIFLFLSRVAFVKGLDLLLEAWTQVRAKLEDCELWIAGPNFDGTASALREKIKKDGLQNVTVMGMVDNLEKDWLLRAAHVFVLPSRGEGQSAAILEAMAYEKPILLTDRCYFPEAVAANAAFECEVTTSGIASQLVKFAELAAKHLEIMGHHARGLIVEKFEIGRVAESLDKETETLLKTVR